VARGTLRVYLGAAPGVGKTYAMLDEGRRRLERGTDVVVAFVETHGRALTAARLDGLEVIARQPVSYRGVDFEELDLAAVLARRPQVALVDELAHTNVPMPGRHEKRWQDVEELLEAGIDVISTVNVQHLESLNDVVTTITGIEQRETVPDSVVRAAEQVELVDMSPESLRRRMAHGNIYARDKVDAALGNYFRVGNLAALRELALLWLADSVDTALAAYREQHGISEPWEIRETIVVALTGGPEGETLVRRAARIAGRSQGDMMALHVVRGDGLSGGGVGSLEELRTLVESLGGSFHTVVGDDLPTAVLEFARGHNATQIVMGASRRSALRATFTGLGTGQRVIRQSGAIDVHVISHDFVGRGRRLPALSGGLTVRRQVAGGLLAAFLMIALTALLSLARSQLRLGSDLLLFLTAVVVVAVVGGFWAALGTAIVASLLLNYFLVPPIHNLTIAQPENLLELGVFLVVALIVSRVVDLAARRSTDAARARAEAETLSALTRDVLRAGESVTDLLVRIREVFAADSVTLLRRETAAPQSDTASLRGSWSVVASAGEPVCQRPEDGTAEAPVDENLLLVLRGRQLPAADQRLLGVVAGQVALVRRHRDLTEAVRETAPLIRSDRLRTAMLAAAGHDLRTPLATATAAVTSLTSPELSWSKQDEGELLATASAALTRLSRVVEDVLDISRVQSDAVRVVLAPVGLDEVVPLALDQAAYDRAVEVAVPADLPPVLADAGLLVRVIANLVENALRYGPPQCPPRVAASQHGDRVELRVVDQGIGISAERREEAFVPFQRLGDRTVGDAGVGLGLAIARGFTEAMEGTLTYEETPGGGSTMVIALPVAEEPRLAAESGRGWRESSANRGESDGDDEEEDPG
jgi:two-component system sensor histidine kinase KdpD